MRCKGSTLDIGLKGLLKIPTCTIRRAGHLLYFYSISIMTKRALLGVANVGVLPQRLISQNESQWVDLVLGALP